MSLVFIEGFGSYGNGAHSSGSGDDMLLQWTQYTSVTVSALAANTNGTRKYVTGSLNSAMRPNLGSFSDDTFIVGFRFYHTSQANENLILRVLNTAGTLIGSVGLLGNRLVYSTSTSGNLATLGNIVLGSNVPIKPNQYYYIEVKLTLDGSAGAVAFRINGVDDASVSSVDTEGLAAGPCEILEFMPNASSDWQSANRLADIYVDDGTTFRGPMEIWYQEADSAGTESGFTPSAGSNHQNVDEIGPDGDTTYNSSTTLQTDSLTTSKALDAAPIALQPMCFARLVSGSSTLRAGTKSDPGGTPTESFGAAVGLGSAYGGVRGLIDETDPDTAAAWTAGNADAAEIMYEQVS